MAATPKPERRKQKNTIKHEKKFNKELKNSDRKIKESKQVSEAKKSGVSKRLVNLTKKAF